MGKISAVFLALLVVCFALVATVGGFYNQDEGGAGIGGGGKGGEREEGGGEGGEPGVGGNSRFLLRESLDVVRTDAGHMRVIRNGGHRLWRSPMHMGLITMEPNSLFIPQYLDSNLILFVRRGEARIGHVYEDDFAERHLKTGDLYRIASGSAFYLVNAAEGQKLYIICSIETSENYGWHWHQHGFRSFFVGGGTNPTSILSGFDPLTMSTAFNVSVDELRDFMTRQHLGPIVYLSDSSAPSMWSKFLDLKEHQRLAHLKRIVHAEEEANQDEEQPTWSFRKLLISIFGEEKNRDDDTRGRGRGPEACNIYERKADFKNDYGWSKAVDENDYSPLRHSDIGVYLVNLTAGSMMAPHVNPRAVEYGIVLRGTGRIQIVFPNGSLAMDAQVKEGDAFWIPRYFPFCQIASRAGPFEFFGFTTSSRDNRPQFLVGANSLLDNMRGPELAAAFGVDEERLGEILDAQRESTILPSSPVAPSGEGEPTKPSSREERAVPKMIRSFGSDMIMGFD
ncbi:vicilin-like seed storage protein At2g28490 [Coffea arabica]|uniref:Vicilin-like seed storage protein At2g28490 n=1 Tax=Coffea arabica TaxID=13443 RepID=A0A6P6U7L1_COFAR|nr:vicilin-like seed storage protein At2g28490 [Coffea arabica]